MFVSCSVSVFALFVYLFSTSVVHGNRTVWSLLFSLILGLACSFSIQSLFRNIDYIYFVCVNERVCVCVFHFLLFATLEAFVTHPSTRSDFTPWIQFLFFSTLSTVMCVFFFFFQNVISCSTSFSSIFVFAFADWTSTHRTIFHRSRFYWPNKNDPFTVYVRPCTHLCMARILR